jgi:uncharacterized protein (DUF488 family)
MWTLGHSNHRIDTVLGLLAGSSIQQVAQVRRFPGLRRHPQFQHEALERQHREAGIAYLDFVRREEDAEVAARCIQIRVTASRDQ